MIYQKRHIEFTDLPADKEGMAADKEGLPADKEGMAAGKAGMRGESAVEDDFRADATYHDPHMDEDTTRFKVRELLDGTILVRENMIRQLPYVLFLTILGVIYIGNRFHAERMVRQITGLKTEVSNLRAEQITTTSELMNISRPCEVADL